MKNIIFKQHQDTNELPEIENSSSINWKKWIGSFVVLIAVLSFFYTNKNDTILAQKDNLDISGIYSKSIDYSHIVRIDTISVMPGIELRTDGSSFRSQEKGYFRLKDVGDAYLNLNLRYPPFIRIVLRNDNSIFINLSDARKTRELFKNLEAKTLKYAN